jgi:ribosomal protein L24
MHTISFFPLFTGVFMNVFNFLPGDSVFIIGGKYKGERAVAVQMKPKMVEVKLLPTLRQVRVMYHNASYIPSDDGKVHGNHPNLNAKMLSQS